MIQECNNNKQASEKIGLNLVFETINLQRNIWETYNDVSIPLQELKDIVIKINSRKDNTI